MENFYIHPTQITPEIHFSPDNNIFFLKGNSAPEDVRALYYPVNQWINAFIDNTLTNKDKLFTTENPLQFQVDLVYFNSSSAKFIYDIFMGLKKLHICEVPIIIKWYYDEEDLDMMEAGKDIAVLAGMEFEFIPKPNNEL